MDRLTMRVGIATLGFLAGLAVGAAAGFTVPATLERLSLGPDRRSLPGRTRIEPVQ